MSPELVQVIYLVAAAGIGWLIRHKWGTPLTTPATPAAPAEGIVQALLNALVSVIQKQGGSPPAVPSAGDTAGVHSFLTSLAQLSPAVNAPNTPGK